MTEIKLTVDVLGIPEAINNLAAAIRGQDVNPTPAAETVTPVAVAPATVAAATAATINPPSTLPTNIQTPAVPAPAPVPEKKITAEDISRAGAALVDQGKMADVINLLKRYGVQAITQLKEDVYPAFANDLRALGATL